MFKGGLASVFWLGFCFSPFSFPPELLQYLSAHPGNQAIADWPQWVYIPAEDRFYIAYLITKQLEFVHGAVLYTSAIYDIY